jgi:hypothetical protein
VFTGVESSRKHLKSNPRKNVQELCGITPSSCRLTIDESVESVRVRGYPHHSTLANPAGRNVAIERFHEASNDEGLL